jgi:hypothetical protein
MIEVGTSPETVEADITRWTAVKNPCIKIQARLKRKVERVAKKDNYV